MARAVARARTRQERQPGLQAVADQRVRSQERRTLLRPKLQGGSQQIGESLEPQQIADPEPGLAELDDLMNSMTRQEEMAFQAWREQRGPREYQCRHF